MHRQRFSSKLVTGAKSPIRNIRVRRLSRKAFGEPRAHQLADPWKETQHSLAASALARFSGDCQSWQTPFGSPPRLADPPPGNNGPNCRAPVESAAPLKTGDGSPVVSLDARGRSLNNETNCSPNDIRPRGSRMTAFLLLPLLLPVDA